MNSETPQDSEPPMIEGMENQRQASPFSFEDDPFHLDASGGGDALDTNITLDPQLSDDFPWNEKSEPEVEDLNDLLDDGLADGRFVDLFSQANLRNESKEQEPPGSYSPPTLNEGKALPDVPPVFEVDGLAKAYPPYLIEKRNVLSTTVAFLTTCSTIYSTLDAICPQISALI